MRCAESQSRFARALTLIDLVVVLAIVGLFIVTAIPLMRVGRKAANEQRDELAAKLWARAFASYAIDNADAVVPAAPHWGWVHRHKDPYGYMIPPDPLVAGHLVLDSPSKSYTFHMIAGRDVPLEAIQSDPATLADFLSRSTQGAPDNVPGTWYYPDTSAQGALAWHPTFGYNGVFIGGSFRHGGLQDPYGLTNYAQGFFYVRRTAEILQPSRLLSFVAARGGDVANTTYWQWGAQYPNTHTIRPGHWLVTPPRAGNLSSFNVVNWNASDTFNASAVPSTWGNVNARLANSKALVIACDGHNETLALDLLRDMRRWANQATSETWQWSGQRASGGKP